MQKVQHHATVLLSLLMCAHLFRSARAGDARERHHVGQLPGLLFLLLFFTIDQSQLLSVFLGCRFALENGRDTLARTQWHGCIWTIVDIHEGESTIFPSSAATPTTAASLQGTCVIGAIRWRQRVDMARQVAHQTISSDH